jgi:magnesium chelatase family protein
MTSAYAWSVALFGVDGSPVRISAQIGTSLLTLAQSDGWQVTGEALERVRAAVRNSGLSWPIEPVLVTASGQLPGDTSLVDLAVACAVLAADGQLPAAEVQRTVFVGELALDGQVRTVRGVLPALLAARQAAARVDRAGQHTLRGRFGAGHPSVWCRPIG